MDDMPTHKRSQRHATDDIAPRSHDRAAAWIVLVGAGATTMSFNIWHALHTGMPLGLALLYGIAPVSLAMGLSHIVAAHKGGWFMKTVTFAAMLAAMAMSVSATGDVVRAAAGPLWWLFGCTVDASALVALQVILSPASRAAARAARRATADAIPQAAPQATGQAISEPPNEPAIQPADEPSAEPSRKPVKVNNEPDAIKARAEYRKSVRAGTPLTDRALAAKFPGHGRTWAAGRIAEVSDGPHVATRTGT